MENLLDQIKAIAEGVDEQTRRAITESLRKLSISLEDSEDTVERIAFAPLQLFAAKIGVDLHIFRRLAAVESSTGLETLAHETQADPLLLGRLLRYWASVSMLTEVDVDTFAANNITKVLASPKGESYVRVYYELVSPVFYELPKFLERTGYVNPTNPSELPLQDAYGFDGDMFAYFETFPQKQALFNTHMELQRNLITNWDTLCSLIRSKHPVPGEVLFVDVGGGNGHQSRRIRAELPDVPGEMILQDLPQVMASAESITGVTKMNYDIFTPQPVRGKLVRHKKATWDES
ncbi:o-methyltransferase-like protein [Penicillium chermesinum]|uniref:O-methyltransferase-like protein n=1 Tax=Penicillium chermesinum TaxID=63820 RepID=A0A9W9P6D3_9EURO|nr:o-methyltransferase-like protein [Penicillium chermesinum]KAJ5238773.1 o-methyltransferase-like protein [Penicillium chermesinum]KAJ6164416.1 o-methyltransferase-like protein [Penicillium chermesinum]